MAQSWAARAADPELESAHGPYAGYHAWHEWLWNQLNEQWEGTGDEITEALDLGAKAQLYALFCRLADGEFEPVAVPAMECLDLFTPTLGRD